VSIQSLDTLKSSAPITGALIFDFNGGRLRLHLVGDSDQQVAHLLSVFRNALVVGDVLDLVDE
jgi:hypothetical protein